MSLLLAFLCLAQPAFRSDVELVRIPVNLERSGDAAVTPDALTSASFTVLEDGVPQQVSLFERESVPLRLCIVLDISHSMMDPRASRLSTGSYGHAITALGAGDEVAVITFAMGTSRVMSWTSAAKAASIPLRLRTEGGTAILDAVKRGMKELDTTTPGRPVILVITDGGENASYTGLGELARSRIQSEAQIHAFQIAGNPTMTPPSVTGRRPLTDKQTGVKTINVLPQVVSDAGGVIYSINEDEDVPAADKEIVRRAQKPVHARLHAGETIRRQVPSRESRSERARLQRPPPQRLSGDTAEVGPGQHGPQASRMARPRGLEPLTPA